MYNAGTFAILLCRCGVHCAECRYTVYLHTIFCVVY